MFLAKSYTQINYALIFCIRQLLSSVAILLTLGLSQGTFTDAQTLTLSGLTGSAQSFAVGGKTAVYPIAAFVGNQFVDTAGAWLGNPQAVFYGVNAQVNLLSLSHTISINPNVALLVSCCCTYIWLSALLGPVSLLRECIVIVACWSFLRAHHNAVV